MEILLIKSKIPVHILLLFLNSYIILYYGYIVVI